MKNIVELGVVGKEGEMHFKAEEGSCMESDALFMVNEHYHYKQDGTLSTIGYPDTGTIYIIDPKMKGGQTQMTTNIPDIDSIANEFI